MVRWNRPAPIPLVIESSAAARRPCFSFHRKDQEETMRLMKISALAVLMAGVSTFALAQEGLQTSPNEHRSPAYQSPNPAGNTGSRGSIQDQGGNNPPMTETGRGNSAVGNTHDRDCSNLQQTAKQNQVGCD